MTRQPVDPGHTGKLLRPSLVTLAAVAVAAHVLPTLTARPEVRAAVWPRLSGPGLPGGVAMTFDDGPHPAGTPAVLAALADLDWRATFFLLGSQVQRYPDVARRIVDAGHEVAVHGFRHRSHLARTAVGLRDDLARAVELISAVTRAELQWFRPPYGVLTAGSVLAARAVGLTPVLWSAWGRDWLCPPPEQVANTVLADLRDGGTVLLHDSDCTSRAGSWRSTAAALPLLAPHLADRRLQVRTLHDHLRSSP